MRRIPIAWRAGFDHDFLGGVVVEEEEAAPVRGLLGSPESDMRRREQISEAFPAFEAVGNDNLFFRFPQDPNFSAY